MALTTSDQHFERVALAREVSELAQELSSIAREGGDLSGHPAWAKFEQLRPVQAKSLLAVRKEIAARNSLLDMISECTGPLPPLPDSGPYVPDIITMTQRTNKLLAAILLKLHGIE